MRGQNKVAASNGTTVMQQHNADTLEPTPFNINAFIISIIKRTIPSSTDIERRTALLQQLSAIVSNEVAGQNNLRLLPFGSSVIGLDTPASDIDLTIDGEMHLGHATGRAGQVAVTCTASQLNKEQRIALLKDLRKSIRRARNLREQQRGFVPHARVPVLKFLYQEKPSLPPLLCDVSIANTDGVWKSRMLGTLLSIDPRALELARLVKLWSKWQGINDPTRRTFNSYGLLLMVIWHLQTLEPPILPTLHALLNVTPDADRPLEGGGRGPVHLQEVAHQRALEYKQAGFGTHNPSTVWELFGSFLHAFWSMAVLWATHDHGDRLRVCTWDAALEGARWPSNCYCAGIEDPFDSEDNAGRTVADVKAVVQAFQSSRHLYYAASIAGMENRAMLGLFGPAAVTESAQWAAATAQHFSRDSIAQLVLTQCPPCIPPALQGMDPRVEHFVREEYGRSAEHVFRLAKTNANLVHWKGKCRRIHRAVRGVGGDRGRDEVVEEVEEVWQVVEEDGDGHVQGVAMVSHKLQRLGVGSTSSGSSAFHD